MKKRKTPEEVIESIKDPSREHTFIREPRGELIPIRGIPMKRAYLFLRSSIYSLLGKRKGKPYMLLHTHPMGLGYFGRALPTGEDLVTLIGSKEAIKTGVIAQQDEKTGKVQGYTYMHLRRNADYRHLMPVLKDLKKLNKSFRDIPIRDYKIQLESLADRMGIDIRYHPAKGYILYEEGGDYFDKKFIKKYEAKQRRRDSLERTVASVIIGFSLLFLLVKIPFTGYIIAGSISANFGTGLFLLSGLLFALLVYFILRKA